MKEGSRLSTIFILGSGNTPVRKIIIK